MQKKLSVKKTVGLTDFVKYERLILCLSLIFLLLIFSKTPSENIRRSLKLCYTTVIPSVFPFMVISSLMINLGAHKTLGRLFHLPIRAIFGCSPNAVSSVILGFLCGFPIGASSAASLFDKNQISKGEFERLLIYVNNPGAAFVIGGIGLTLFNSAKVGRIIYLSVILSAVIAGIISRFVYSKDEAIKGDGSEKEAYIMSFSSAVTSSLADSSINMLNVCGCVLFFSVPVGIISEIIGEAQIPLIILPFLSSVFEISGGVSATASLKTPLVSIMLCAFACSWSGLSVHLQVFSVCRGRGISFSPYVISKLLQSLLSPILVFLYFKLFNGDSELSFSPDENQILANSSARRVIFSLFFISLIFILFKKRHKDGTPER